MSLEIAPHRIPTKSATAPAAAVELATSNPGTSLIKLEKLKQP
jgi:hypothetical protein